MTMEIALAIVLIVSPFVIFAIAIGYADWSSSQARRR
jgi:hypothetical protein